MSEPLFITYANNLFRENPENLNIIFDLIRVIETEQFAQVNEWQGYSGEEDFKIPDNIDYAVGKLPPLLFEAIIPDIIKLSKDGQTSAMSETAPIS